MHIVVHLALERIERIALAAICPCLGHLPQSVLLFLLLYELEPLSGVELLLLG